MTTDATAARGSYIGGLFKKEHLVTFAKYCPLVTAILAPLSTLMDIPALSVSLTRQLGTTGRQALTSFSNDGIL